MSQETLVSQSSLSDSPKPATSWFPVKLPRGYEALPYDDSGCESDEEDSDAEFWALKPATDIEANPVPSSFPTSSAFEHNTSEGTSSPPTDSPSPSPPRTSTSTRMAGVLKMSVILTTAGLPSALFFSAFAWLVGGIILRSIFKVPPYDTMDSGAAFKASMAGAPVVAAAAGALAFVDFIVRRLPRLPRADRGRQSTGAGTTTGVAGYDPLEDAVSVASVCALASVLAMPLGFVMVPRLATEAFGAWHALAWSATGLGVPIGGLVLAFLPQMLWCDKVDL